MGKFYLSPYVPEGPDAHTELVESFNPRALLILALTVRVPKDAPYDNEHVYVLQVTWMCRLSYNTFRRGLFSL